MPLHNKLEVDTSVCLLSLINVWNYHLFGHFNSKVKTPSGSGMDGLMGRWTQVKQYWTRPVLVCAGGELSTHTHTHQGGVCIVMIGQGDIWGLSVPSSLSFVLIWHLFIWKSSRRMQGKWLWLFFSNKQKQVSPIFNLVLRSFIFPLKMF